VETDADTRARAESALAEIDALVNRLRRIEGQVRGLQKMIQEGKDCAAVLTQVTAAKAALDKVGMHVISHRMRECIEETSGVKLDQDSLEQAFQVFMKYAPYPMASNDSEEGSEW
jgi:DNA-binding FrmR family transcriptional regulator